MNSAGWEKAVIGTALFDPQTMELAEDLLPSDFTEERQEVWSQIIALHRDGGMDERAVVEALKQSGFLREGVLGEEYLLDLLGHRGDAMQTYVQRVMSASNKRQLSQVAGIIAAEALDEDMDDQEAMDNAETRIMALRRGKSREMGVPLGSIISVFQDRMQGMLDGTFTPAWVPEVRPIRDILHYIDEEDFLVFASRPGEGKSSFMRYMFVKAALEGTPVLIFNLENSDLEYAKFSLSLEAQVDSNKLKSPGLLSEEERERLRNAAERLANAPLFVKSLGSPPVSEIVRISRAHILRHNIKRIGVDYIQLCYNGKQKKVQDVSHSSEQLRALAKNFGVPVMANAQLNRDIERRGEGANPILADLRESGSLEQDSTIVIMSRLVWPTPTDVQLRSYPDNVDENGNLYEGNGKAVPVRAHVLKNRNGSTGVTRPFLWRKHVNDFNVLEV